MATNAITQLIPITTDLSILIYGIDCITFNKKNSDHYRCSKPPASYQMTLSIIQSL